MFDKKCKECGAYRGHSPRCSKITFDEAKKQLQQYYDLWVGREGKWAERESYLSKKLERYQKEMEFWKGKFLVVRDENNKLRKKGLPLDVEDTLLKVSVVFDLLAGLNKDIKEDKKEIVKRQLNRMIDKYLDHDVKVTE